MDESRLVGRPGSGAGPGRTGGTLGVDRVHVDIDSARVKSGAANPVREADLDHRRNVHPADYIDMNLVRAAGGCPSCSTRSTPRRPWGSPARVHLRTQPAARSGAAPTPDRSRRPHTPAAGIGDRAFLDIDSLLRRVNGRAKEGASYGHAKVSGCTVLRKGLTLWSRLCPPR